MVRTTPPAVIVSVIGDVTYGPTLVASFEFDRASVAPTPRSPSRRRKKGRGLKLFATLLVLGGMVAAGLVFGQPYLFPGDWDDATAPDAQALETSRGVDFGEPLAVDAEPSAQFATHLKTQLAPVSPDELAQWRALEPACRARHRRSGNPGSRRNRSGDGPDHARR